MRVCTGRCSVWVCSPQRADRACEYALVLVSLAIYKIWGPQNVSSKLYLPSLYI
ncbi:unnamed protein product [Periconia digitata]|uniref:Uncharacterized protein n=1 Tax=Periconia digitata TaxID=1303443 RepID=A0A9W4U9L1_9PLEO|nr:unnamed protein product [Periconia digitata]